MTFSKPNYAFNIESHLNSQISQFFEIVQSGRKKHWLIINYIHAFRRVYQINSDLLNPSLKLVFAFFQTSILQSKSKSYKSVRNLQKKLKRSLEMHSFFKKVFGGTWQTKMLLETKNFNKTARIRAKL